MVYIMSCSFINMESKINEPDAFFCALGGVWPDTRLFDFHAQPVSCHPTL